MKQLIVASIALFLFSGCVYVNERGISAKQYNECKEYYDSMGYYHKDCPENMVEYKDVKEGVKKLDYFHLFTEEPKPKVKTRQEFEEEFYDF